MKNHCAARFWKRHTGVDWWNVTALRVCEKRHKEVELRKVTALRECKKRHTEVEVWVSLLPFVFLKTHRGWGDENVKALRVEKRHTEVEVMKSHGASRFVDKTQRGWVDESHDAARFVEKTHRGWGDEKVTALRVYRKDTVRLSCAKRHTSAECVSSFCFSLASHRQVLSVSLLALFSLASRTSVECLFLFFL